MERLLRHALQAALALAAAVPAAAQLGESPYIFGVHDSEGAPHMADKRKGWILFTEELGRDPQNAGGRDYRPWADQGFGVIVRLNHGYGPTTGTLPYARHYAAFAQRAARFVAASPGAHIWVVGNEMNWDQEWPRYEGVTEEITPELYVQAFRQVRGAIRGLPGHAADQVVPGAIGTYGPPTAGGLSFVQYHARVLELIGPGGLDAIAIHTYTHGPDPALIADETRMGPPYQAYRYNFRAYRDYLAAHPAWARGLPVYITETDQVEAWEDANRGWVRAAYREIDDWNKGAGNQKVRALCLYRFCRGCDRWDINGKGGVIADFRQALDNDYRWGAPAAALDADVLDGESAVGGAFTPGERRTLRVRVRNTGASTWNAADAVRLGTNADNNVAWSAFGCGGYALSAGDARAFLCGPVAPGAAHDLTFVVTAPPAGTARLSLRMVRDGVAWFGESFAWTLPVASGPPLAARVLDTASVPVAIAPGETRPVVLRVQNTGSSTWTPGEMHRLGAAGGNTVAWSAFACGGFARNPGDARAYLCQAVPPGGTADFAFNVTAPASGPAVLAVQMVKELVAWFGEARGFTIPLAANPCLASVPGERWKGEYFPNTTLSGPAPLVRDEGGSGLGLAWGGGGPGACGIGADRFSARFTRSLSLPAGRYRFTARSDDGVRVWIDGVRLLDKWIVQAPTSYSVETTLAAGSHDLRVEYFENEGEAVAELSWEALAADPCLASVPADRFRGEYYASRDLSGAPRLVRDEGASGLAFDWGTGSPAAGCGVPVDGFSARFTRSVSFEAGSYRFSVSADDGARLYVDGALVLDAWKDQAPTTYTVDVPLSAGPHGLRLDYYENGGGAVARLSWTRLADTPSPPAAPRLGFNVLNQAWAAMEEARHGARFFLVMDDLTGARALKAAYPDATVMVRQWVTAKVPPAQFVSSYLGLAPGTDPAGLVYTGMNEGDVFGQGAGELEERAVWDIEVARIVRERGGVYAAGTFSMGNPDFTNPAVCDIVRRHYAGPYNRGEILIDMHNYSPNMAHIDQPQELKWFERRWEFLFTCAGFDPGVRGIVSSETGVDEGGVGGFVAHQATPAQVAHWAEAFLRAQAEPLVVDGKSYPSPFLGGAFFQLTHGRRPEWGGYEMAPYLDALRPLYR